MPQLKGLPTPKTTPTLSEYPSEIKLDFSNQADFQRFIDILKCARDCQRTYSPTWTHANNYLKALGKA